MARGGGTGSRTNKKKKTDGPQNGTSESAGSRPLKASLANGGGDGDQVANIKHKNNKQTSRKQKEETPPVPVVEEETKEEKAKLVPTSEQLRLAQITQSQDNTMDPQRKAKISQVIDITGKSEDEVATALFDCGWDAARAIDMLLEEGGADGMGSWEETGKKKKKKNVEEEKGGAGKENEDWNDDFDPNNKFDDNRERSRQRGPPRLRSRGGGQGMTREDQGTWKARENQENDRNNYEGGRGRGRGGLARGGRGGAVGGRGGGPIGGQRGGRGGGQRGFGDRGNIDPRVVERREPGSAPGDAPGRPGESFGQIETWNPVGESAGPGSAVAGGGPGPVQQPGGAPGDPGQLRARRGPMGNNKDAFDNAGNWGDDFPAAEDWDNDEYTGSLSDTKVFTPSGSGQGPKSAIGEPLNGETRNGGAVQQPSLAAPGSKAQPSPANNSLSGSSYPQPIDISALLQKPGGLTGAPGGPTSLSQYQQAATKDLKSAIGLAPGQGSLSYSSAAPGSSFASAAPGSAFSPIKPAAVTNGSGSASKALPRARLPPPSKIPSSAVEMPGDSLSNLDVQFGGLDLQFGGAPGSNNENNSTNFDFGAGSPPSQKQDLEKERPSVMGASTTCCQAPDNGSAFSKVSSRSLGAVMQGGLAPAGGPAPPGLQLQVPRPAPLVQMPSSTQQRPSLVHVSAQLAPAGHLSQGTQLLSNRLQSGQVIQTGNPGLGHLPASTNINNCPNQAGPLVAPFLTQQQARPSENVLLSTQTQGHHRAGHAGQVAQSEVDVFNVNKGVPSDQRLNQEPGMQWCREVEEEEERIFRLKQGSQQSSRSNDPHGKPSQGRGTSQSSLTGSDWRSESAQSQKSGGGGKLKTFDPEGPHHGRPSDDRPGQASSTSQSSVRGVLPVPGHLRRDQATSVSGLVQAGGDVDQQQGGGQGGQHQGATQSGHHQGVGAGQTMGGEESRGTEKYVGDDSTRFSSIPPGPPGKPEAVGPSASLDSYKSQGASQSAGVKDVGQSLSSALASAGIKPSSSTDSVPGYGRVGEAGGSSRSSETGKSQGYGAQRSPGPLLAKADNLGGYNNGATSYSGYQGGKAGQGFPQSSSGYPGGFERQQSYNSGASSNGLTGGYSSRGGGSSAYNPPREASFSNSYGSGNGVNSSSTSTNYGSNFGASTTNYSPYTGSSNSYSSSSNKSSSQQQSSSSFSSSAATTSSGPSSQFAGESGNSTAGSGKTGNSYDSTQTSSSAGTYGGVGQSTSGSNVSSLGLSANSTLSSSSKMSVNTTSGKMVPGMPPGVPGVLPAQYMIGANAAAGFPAYLANLAQAPAMAAYGGYGVGGHQLEDLAALQRSTLAASLPQLVGSQAGGAAQGTPAPGKGPNSGYYDPASQFGGGSAAAAGSLASRQTDPTSSFPSDSSGKFGSAGDSTSSPVPSSVAQQTQQQAQQPTPFNALASTFAAAAPQQHPTLPPGYAYFYGGVGGMGAQLAAYGQGLPAAAGYPATHPGIPAPTVAGPTNTTQFQKQAYGSSYGNSYGDSLSLGQSNTGYKNSYGQSESQGKSNTSGSSAGPLQGTLGVQPTGPRPTGSGKLGMAGPLYW